MSRFVCRNAHMLARISLMSLACAPALAEKPDGPSPAPAAAAQSSSMQPKSDRRQSSGAASTAQPLTPAQIQYGLPVTPLIGGPVDTDVTKPLSLQRAIRIGLLRQNSIAIALAQTDSARARLTQARSSYFPQVTPTFSFSTSLSPGSTSTFNGQTFGGANRSETRSEVIAVRQNIFDTGRREANVGAARRNVFASEYGLGNQRQDVILSVTSAYFNLLRDRELVRVQEESVRRAQTTLDAISAEVAVGTAAKSDTFQAESDLANARVSLLSAQTDARIAEANLKNQMGVVGSLPLVLDNTPIAPPNTDPDPIALDRYIATAYTNRLDLKQQQERIYSQGYSVRSARISAGLSISADVSEGYALDPNAGEERTFSVSATYPLFDAGNARAAVRDAKAQWEEQKRTLDQLQQSVRYEIDQAYSTREQSKQRLVAANVAVTAGQQNYAAALAKNKEGLINILELINAEVQLVNAQVNQVNAIYDYYIATASLQRNTGINDPIYQARVPGVKPIVQPGP